MSNLRFIGLLILLLGSGSFCFSVPTDILKLSGNELSDNFAADIQELSTSNLVTPFDLFNKKTPSSPTAVLIVDNQRTVTKSKYYYSYSYLIQPGLSLQDIIFPFHSFL